MTETAHTKSVTLRAKGAGGGVPDTTQLAAINALTMRDFAAEEVVVREFVLAHNAIDRDNECMDEGLLADFARTLPGKGSYINHPTSWRSDGGPAEGRIFGARVEKMSFESARQLLREPNLKFPPDRADASVLFTQVFFAKTTGNADLLLKMDAGIVGDCSIGFTATDLATIKDSEGRDLQAMRWMGPGEGLEMSLVWLGAQPGARAVKSASTESNAMTPQEIAAMQADNARLKSVEQTAIKTTAFHADLKTALGDNAALADQPAAVVAGLVSAGVAHRKSLVDDIVTAERHLKMCGDDDASVKAAGELYDSLPTSKLEALRKSLQARAPAAPGTGTVVAIGSVQHADPNATKVGDEANAAKAVGGFGSKLFA